MNFLLFVKKWADESGIPHAHAKKLADSFLCSLSDAIATSNELQIPGFGLFEVRPNMANGYAKKLDPFGKPFKVKEDRIKTVKFKAGNNLRRVVSSGGGLKLISPMKTKRKRKTLKELSNEL